jgi:prepilin-type N-terminal cleavage/methylation domain-containing protein
MSRLDLRIIGRRRGFTLIEMLVVLALMLVLAALAIAFVPRMNERAKTPRGVSQLQMWLLIARQWAKRDNTPTGIRLQTGRLYPTPATPNPSYVSDLQYIQQPLAYHAYDQTGGNDSFVEPYSAWNTTPAPGTYYPVNSSTGTAYTTANAPNMLKVLYKPATSPTAASLVDLYGGNATGASSQLSQPALWQVQRGDYLEMPTGGAIFQIVDVVQDPFDWSPAPGFAFTFPPPPGLPPTGDYKPGNVLVLSKAHGLGTGITQTDYRIIRGPRILSGEKGLQLPQDVAIDTSTNTLFGNSLPQNPFTGEFDILFAPSGQVISRGLSTDKILLWVRDVSQDTTVGLPGVGIGPGAGGLPAGDQDLVVVHTRTGFIGAHNVFSGVSTVGLTAVTTAGTSVQITVANAAGIKVGDYLIIDANTAANTALGIFQETQQVTNVAGNTITLAQMMSQHLAGQYRVISDPYSYVRSAQSSGI